jgi:hypothetical protein
VLECSRWCLQCNTPTTAHATNIRPTSTPIDVIPSSTPKNSLQGKIQPSNRANLSDLIQRTCLRISPSLTTKPQFSALQDALTSPPTSSRSNCCPSLCGSCCLRSLSVRLRCCGYGLLCSSWIYVGRHTWYHCSGYNPSLQRCLWKLLCDLCCCCSLSNAIDWWSLRRKWNEMGRRGSRKFPYVILSCLFESVFVGVGMELEEIPLQDTHHSIE